MLGDDAQPATSDGPRVRATSGPRHAAPRKSLLTKLHVPAGKAVALAAMPTAVLMGMGMTPHLAQADEPKTPSFTPGACVSQPDTPSPTASGQDAKKAEKDGKDAKSGSSGKDSTGTPSPSASPQGEDKPAPTASPSASASGDSAAKDSPSAATTAPTPTPSPTSSYNPLDPLGLGNLLTGLLGGGKSSSPTPAPTTSSPTPAPTTTAPKPDPTSTGGSDAGSSADSGKKSAEDAAKGATDTVKKATKALKDATATPKPTATPSPSPTAEQGYPCPTYDAKALDDAKTEGGIPLLPDEPWTLKSSILTLHGLNYDGIVQVKTASGEIKDVLKFTTTGIDIGDLDQFVVGANGKGHTEVKAAKGSTSTITGGTTTLYTESLSGNLLGLIPITFTPKAPPPLTLPELFFTNVTVINAGQFGGNLHVPGMQVLPGLP